MAMEQSSVVQGASQRAATLAIGQKAVCLDRKDLRMRAWLGLALLRLETTSRLKTFREVQLEEG
jgi:hypothetical protein